MTDHDKRPGGSALLQKLTAIPPLRLPGLVVFLISRRSARSLSGQLHDLLDFDEKTRSTEFGTRDLRDRFVTGRAALRMILSMLEGGAVPETDWRFASSTNGKPYVRAPASSTRSFNLSYADDLIAIAVSKEADVGVDIEIDHEIPQSDLPWHLFSTDEQRLLRATPVAEFPPVFLRLWTLKEAIAKRTGQGFSTVFSEINTIALPVVDGLESIKDHPTSDTLLFHTDLTVHGTTVFLSVSTAPLSRSHDGPVG